MDLNLPYDDTNHNSLETAETNQENETEHTNEHSSVN